MASVLRTDITKAVTRTSEGELEIFGSGFKNATKVHFIDPAGKTFSAVSFNVVSDQIVTCVCPVFSESGLAKVFVTVNGADSTFTAAPPPSASATGRSVDSSDSFSGSRFVNSFLEKNYTNEFEVLPPGFLPGGGSVCVSS
ncbi:hypothetical protein PAQ31011_03047 [Pandoraea aquatica]|uniref:IPT/TIG domain-containing protein n=1 Tax=Pandoraea aquatica TaxID=2508290 RepID=A0A5E4W2N8_9BURK|nr:hypothetical protein [Pandoraea aquatica]VVE18962.1 hypothetical protein PAQ31011_03047 [Pandoraea aquatica]